MTQIIRLLWKRLYLFYHIITVVFRVPTWYLYYLVTRRWNRDKRSASELAWLKCIRQFLHVSVKAGIKPHTVVVAPNRAALRHSLFVWIPVLPKEYIKASAATPNKYGAILPPWAGQPGDGSHIPAFWYIAPGPRLKAALLTDQHCPEHRPDTAAGQPRMVLYLHGGAYVAGSTVETDPGSQLQRTLPGSIDLDVLAVEYRLATNEPYPAALQDAAAAWLYLTKPAVTGGLGIPANEIIVLGDSAGGNLSIALVRWLEEMASKYGENLGKPKHLVLISPWLDVTMSLSSDWPQLDIVPLSFGHHGRSSLLTSHDPSFAKSPLLSPLFDSNENIQRVFSGIHIYISSGECECLRPEIDGFVEKLCASREKENWSSLTMLDNIQLVSTPTQRLGLVYEIYAGLPHDWPTLPGYSKPTLALWNRLEYWLRTTAN